MLLKVKLEIVREVFVWVFSGGCSKSSKDSLYDDGTKYSMDSFDVHNRSILE